MLTVVTTAWAGARPIYQPWHIVNVDRMLRRHLTIPFRHVCVTDNVAGVRAEGIEAVSLWPVSCAVPEQTKRHYLNNWLRLGLFDPDVTGEYLSIDDGDVVVSLDADIVIRRNIDHLFRDLPAFKILSFKNRQHLQGGIFAVRPGYVSPNPWEVLHNDRARVVAARRWGGSDQALLSELFHARSLPGGDVATWNEDDGIAINAQFYDLDWSLFFRTGHKKCWDVRMPEAREYYENSGRDIVTEARQPDALPAIVDPRTPHPQSLQALRKFRLLQINKRKT